MTLLLLAIGAMHGAQASGYTYAGFEFYLTNLGESCDDACERVGGSNLHDAAMAAISENNCAVIEHFAADRDYVTTEGGTSCNTLGMLLDSSATHKSWYYCATEGNSYCGVAPGESYDMVPNCSVNECQYRQFVCACSYAEYTYEWCQDYGCIIEFELKRAGYVEVLATDYASESEYLDIYVNGESYGTCNPGRDQGYDYWHKCDVPAGVIKMDATRQVDCCKHSDSDIGYTSAQVVVRIPTSLQTVEAMTLDELTTSFHTFQNEMFEEITQLKNQVTLLEATNDAQATTIDQQADEIKGLEDLVAGLMNEQYLTSNSFVRSNYYFYEPGVHNLPLSANNSFCSITMLRFDGDRTEYYSGCTTAPLSTWYVRIWDSAVECTVYCITW